MAVEISSNQGFFSIDGRKQISESSVKQSSEESNLESADDSVTLDPSLAKEAGRFTDAVVSKISSQLNARGSGLDSGVADNVLAAVYSALERRGTKGNTEVIETEERKEVGGTYQNFILRGGKPAPSQTTPTTPDTTSPSQNTAPSSTEELSEVSTPGFPSNPIPAVPEEPNKIRGRKKYREEQSQEDSRRGRSFDRPSKFDIGDEDFSAQRRDQAFFRGSKGRR